MSEALATKQPQSIIQRTGERFGVDPNKLLHTMRMTCFKQTGKPGAAPVEVSNEQMMALLIVAEQYKLNPFTKEIYAFADKGGIVPVVGVDGWARLANESGFMDGVTFTVGPIGTYTAYRQAWGEQKGQRVLKAHEVNGPEFVTCTVHRKDRAYPIEVTEYLSECWRDTDPWNTAPARMLRHRAMIQAYRVAFGFAGIHDEDEAMRIVESRAAMNAPQIVAGESQQQRLAKRLGVAKAAEVVEIADAAEVDQDTGEVTTFGSALDVMADVIDEVLDASEGRR